MENYTSSYSYAESGDSSPRSREIDFENQNPPPFDDPAHPNPNPNPNPNHKVKFMVSYNGKIQPRSHDNTLSYIGGETKILSVDRNVKISTFFSKLSTILGPDNGNNDGGPGFGFGSGSGFCLKYQLPGEELDALISVTNDDDLENLMHEYDRACRGLNKPVRLRLFLFPVQKDEPDRFNPGPPSLPLQSQVNNNVDFLFGLENSPVQVDEPDHIQLNRVQLKNDEGNGTVFPGYWQHQQSPLPPPQPQPQQQPMNVEQQPLPPPQLQQFQQQGIVVPQFQQQPPQNQQPIYMVHAPGQGGVYHAPMMRPVTGQVSGYYQQVYGKMGYSEGMGVQVRPVVGNMGEGYQQQVYYGAPGTQSAAGGVVVSGGELRTVGGVDPKVVQK